MTNLIKRHAHTRDKQSIETTCMEMKLGDLDMLMPEHTSKTRTIIRMKTSKPNFVESEEQGLRHTTLEEVRNAIYVKLEEATRHDKISTRLLNHRKHAMVIKQQKRSGFF